MGDGVPSPPARSVQIEHGQPARLSGVVQVARARLWVPAVKRALPLSPVRVAAVLAGAAALCIPAGEARSQPFDVVWQAGSYAVQGGSPVRIGTIRDSSGTTAYVAWIDHTRTRLGLYPGLKEPPGATPRGSGSVPSGQRWRLLATFNGAFKATAGAGGFLVNGRAPLPLQYGLGTIVETRAGRVDIVAWHGAPAPRTLVLARQNLPLLVAAGKPNPGASCGPAWGGALNGATAVW